MDCFVVPPHNDAKRVSCVTARHEAVYNLCKDKKYFNIKAIL